jgi:hypothetical protein
MLDKTPPLVKTVELVVFTSFWHGWTTSLPFFVGIVAGLSWASHVVVLTVAVVWNDVLIPPVVDTVSSIATTLLSEVVNLIATSVESFKNIEFAFIVHAVHRQFVVTSV